MELTGKNGLVLGASRGIGRAIARSLAAQGVQLILPWCADWPDAAQAMQEEFSNHLCLATDLRCPQSVQELVQVMTARFPCLHILINNIERGGMPVVHGAYQRPVNHAQWQLEMDTTLQAKWQVFTQCFPLLSRAETAAVINISSIAALTGRSGPAGLLFSEGYAAANRAIASFTETWARLGAPSIRVNEIMLGLIEQRHGPGTRGWTLLSAAEQQQILDHTLLGRWGKPEEVAAAVLFILQTADFMTGACLRLDGGFVLGGERVPEMPEGVL